MYDVLSPDGFSIKFASNFRSLKSAKAYFLKWKQQYKAQGYYSTVMNGERVRIPFDDIDDYCEIRLVEKIEIV